MGNTSKQFAPRRQPKDPKSALKEKYPFYEDDSLKRTKIFYCTHTNRKEGLFHKRIAHVSKVRIDILNVLSAGDGQSYAQAENLLFHIFGKCRIRKNLRLSITRLLEDMLKNHAKLNYQYYFKKNCPRPADWHNKKEDYIKRFERKAEM